jgi:hypothetical protein
MIQMVLMRRQTLSQPEMELKPNDRKLMHQYTEARRKEKAVVYISVTDGLITGTDGTITGDDLSANSE